MRSQTSASNGGRNATGLDAVDWARDLIREAKPMSASEREALVQAKTEQPA